MKRSHVVLSVLCALTLLACSSGKKKLELGGSCSLNSDCAEGLLCKFGACHKACVKSIDCATGERCVQVDGVAVCQMVGESSCDQYGNCHTPLSCRAVDNTCRNKCPTGNECLPGQVCSATFCVESSEVVANPDASVPAPDATPTPDTATSITPDTAADRPQTPDASPAPDAGKPGEAGGLLACEDNDGDGYGKGPGCRGTDCDDTNTNVWASCGACVDSDSDGYFAGCDRYSTIKGPDCDDTAPFCTDSCADGDKNGTADCAEYWFGKSKAIGIGFNSQDGNILVTGGIQGVGYGGTDFHLTKLTPSGRVLWQKIYGTPKEELIFAATQLADGSLFLGGGTGTGTSVSPFYVRLGQDGAVLASKTVSATKTPWSIHGLLARPNGNVIVDGWDGSNPWVGELSKDLLSFSWVANLGGASASWVSSMAGLPNGDFLAAFDRSGSGGHLARLGPTGEVRWARSGLGGQVPVVAVSPDDGNVVMTDFGVGKPFSVTKLSPDGDVLWRQASTGVGSGDPWTIMAIAGDGSIFASATSNYPGTSQYSWLVKLTSAGQPQWTRKTTGDRIVEGLLVLSDVGKSNLLVTGSGTIGRIGTDPDTSCVVAPQTDTLKTATASFTSITLTSTPIPPWALADYPLSTMPGAVIWTGICPANQ